MDSWLEYTAPMASPPLFKKWAGISLLAGALERKVYTYVAGYKSNLYPNMYIFLLAPPAVGKTVMTSMIHDFFEKLEEHKLAPSAVSRGSLMDALHDAQRSIITAEGKAITFNSLMVVVNELQVFIPEYNPDFMSTITDIYDCKPYGEKKRGKDLSYKMMAPQLNLIAATTPANLQTLLPENAYEHGFMTRVIMVYADRSRMIDLFDEPPDDVALRLNLTNDLIAISKLAGAMEFTAEARVLLNNWHKTGGAPKPDHPRLINYNGRRTAHVIKLSMIASASRGDDLTLCADDVRTALDWLTECEAEMDNVFSAMKAGSERQIMMDCAHTMYRTYIKHGNKAIREALVIEYLQMRGIPSHSVERLLKLMIAAEMFTKAFDGLHPVKLKAPSND
jgi:Protein of unknown function (DUF3987)